MSFFERTHGPSIPLDRGVMILHVAIAYVACRAAEAWLLPARAEKLDMLGVQLTPERASTAGQC